MNDLCVWQYTYFKPTIFNSPTYIILFKKKKKSIIKSSYLFKYILSNHHGCPRYNICLNCFLSVPSGQPKLARDRIVWKNFIYKCQRENGSCRGKLKCSLKRIRGKIHIKKNRRNDSKLLIFQKKINQIINCILKYFCIRI